MWPGIADRAAVAALLLAASAPLGLGGGARADEATPAGGGALRVRADPPRLVLGRDGAAELRVAAPPDVETLSFTASVGRVEAVRPLPGGGFVARYLPPLEQVPAVAIVAAVARTARGLEDGWIAIPLSGQGDARVSGAPGAAVELRIGDRTYGPATVGKNGVAVIPVVVPPGVRQAHQGFRPIDLRVPETTLLHVVQDRTEVLADRDETVQVLAYVAAPHGAARRGDAPVFEPSRGTVAVTEREPGAFQAVWSLPPGRAGEERLSVRLPAAPASRGIARVVSAAGAPALVAVAFDRPALVAGGEAAVVTARALDAAGNLVPATLELSASGGILSALEQRGPGETVARLEVGTRLRGRSEAVVTATVEGLGIAGSRALPVRPGEAALVRFRTRAGVIRSDGRRETELRLSVVDRFGNPVSAVPSVRAAQGRVLSVDERAPGEFAVRYVGPSVREPVPETLRVDADRAHASEDRLLVAPGPALTLDARAGAALDVRGGFTGVAGGVGAERPADVAFALRRGVAVGWRLEAEALRGRGGAGHAAVLAGAGVRRELGARAELAAAATAGAVLFRDGVALGGRIAVALGLRRAAGSPFVELSLLGAASGASGAFAAAAISGGLRFDLEAHDGDDPDRR